MLKFLTAGESHGPAEVAILEGIPAGLKLTREDIQTELEKRRAETGRGGRGKIEGDRVKILSGVRHGKTLGSPIALMVENRDFANWGEKMSIADTPGINKEEIALTNPRPGHADLPGSLKYGFDDIRNVLERASARETVMRVAVGAVCKKLLSEFGVSIASHTIQIGKIKLEREPKDFEEVASVFKTDPQIHCIDHQVSGKMKEEIIATTIKKDTLGGVIEIVAHNVPVGLGNYVHYDRKLDGQLAQILMSIPSVKAVEIGEGINIAQLFGSQVHDEIFYQKGGPARIATPARKDSVSGGQNVAGGYFRKTNRAGGVEGGVSNGEDIVCRVYHKPLSTIGNALSTVDIKTKESTKAVIERSDICVIPRAGVISESAVAFVLANAFLEKFGGDSIPQTKYNFQSYLSNLSHL